MRYSPIGLLVRPRLCEVYWPMLAHAGLCWPALAHAGRAGPCWSVVDRARPNWATLQKVASRVSETHIKNGHSVYAKLLLFAQTVVLPKQNNHFLKGWAVPAESARSWSMLAHAGPSQSMWDHSSIFGPERANTGNFGPARGSGQHAP